MEWKVDVGRWTTTHFFFFKKHNYQVHITRTLDAIDDKVVKIYADGDYVLVERKGKHKSAATLKIWLYSH